MRRRIVGATSRRELRSELRGGHLSFGGQCVDDLAPQQPGRQLLDQRPCLGDQARTPFRRPTSSRSLSPMASSLDRAVGVLSHRTDLWEALGAEAHTLLTQQPSPHGAFFAWLDRLVHDQGAVSRPALLAELGRDDAPPELAQLAAKVGRFHEMPAGDEARAELDVIIDRLRLLAVQGELELLATSTGLSDSARTRQRALLERQRDLKDRLSRPPPVAR